MNRIIKNKYYSILLVFFQFLFIGFLILNSSLRSSVSGFSVFIFGIFIGIWSVWVMRKSKIRIKPEVAKGAELVISGPYKYIRHPMYTSVILASFGMVISNINFLSFIFLSLLIIILFLKINYEEKELVKYFLDYKLYSKKTKLLIPWIL